MKIIKIYQPAVYPNDLVIQKLDSQYYAFSVLPGLRELRESDLRPLPGFRPIGNNGTVYNAFPQELKQYGLELVDNET